MKWDRDRKRQIVYSSVSAVSRFRLGYLVLHPVFIKFGIGLLRAQSIHRAGPTWPKTQYSTRTARWALRQSRLIPKGDATSSARRPLSLPPILRCQTLAAAPSDRLMSRAGGRGDRGGWSRWSPRSAWSAPPAAHCAGSDSLLTIDVLLAMLNRFFMNVDVLAHAGTIVGLA